MIIICDYCKMSVCPSSCPSFEGKVAGLDSLDATCEVCGARLYEGDEIYRPNGKIICGECAEELVSPELLELLDCADIKEFFDSLL